LLIDFVGNILPTSHVQDPGFWRGALKMNVITRPGAFSTAQLHRKIGSDWLEDW